MGGSKPPRPKASIGDIGKNILKNNFRGIIGSLFPLCILSWQSEYGNNKKTVEIMWMMMFWFFLWQPVAIPIIGLIPVFFLPMTGTMSSADTCGCYMNENIHLFLIAGMLICLLNNSGVDRRITLWFLGSGDCCQFSGKRLVLKACTAAFFLSMFSNRLITSYTLIQYMTSALMKMQQFAAKSDTEPNFEEMRYIINNAIQTSSGIGSTAIIHSSIVTILFRAIWAEAPDRSKEYPDIFNYLQYSAFAFPLAFLIFLLNTSYHMLLINICLGKSMSLGTMTELRRIIMDYRAEIPKRVSLHEKLSVFFTVLYLLMFFFRWNQWIEGWSDFRRDENSPSIPRIKDATTGAIFLLLLHILPKSYGFLKFLDAEKKSELPPLRAESSILWWRFVDKNINYGYLFIFGAAVALMNSARETGLSKTIAENFGTGFTTRPWNDAIFLVCFITALLANIMTAVGACAAFLPFVMSMSIDAALPWPSKVYCAALGVGIASNFGFSLPFKYTPAYFCHYTGKVPIKKMIKYSFVSVWISLILLWAALIVWAPYLFDPTDQGIIAVDAPISDGATTTTEAAEAPPPEEGCKLRTDIKKIVTWKRYPTKYYKCESLYIYMFVTQSHLNG